MARGDQLARQWKILQTLMAAKNGKSAGELSRELECHLRTVYRDLEALQAAGFPIYTHRENAVSRWALMGTARHPFPLPLSLTEMMALYFSRGLLMSLRESVFYESLESLFLKIKATLPPEYIHHLDQINKVFQIAPAPYRQLGAYKKNLDDLNQAILDRRYVEMTYYAVSKREETQRVLAPYKIRFFRGTYYLIGYCMLRREIRVFAVDRIIELRIRDDVFPMDCDVDIDRITKSSLGVFLGESQKIRIWFSPEVGDYIKETVWHTSQTIHPHKDDSLILEMHVAVSDELKQWVMRWGADARVLEPQVLTDMIQKEAFALVDRYKSDTNLDSHSRR